MTTYTAPVDDMRFVINELAGLGSVAALPGMEEVTPDLVDAILEEAGKFGTEVLAPLNEVGDQQGCTLENGVVRMPEGFGDAYAQFIEMGWNGVPSQMSARRMVWASFVKISGSLANSPSVRIS